MKLQELISKKPSHCNMQEWFTKIADYLCNDICFFIAGVPHSFIEIEFYFQGKENHPDPFVHAESLQKTCGHWYFHRTRGTYKAASFKGMDITFANDNVFGGILIRGLQRIDGVVIDGPSLCVDHILATAGYSSVAALDEQILPYKVWELENHLLLKEIERPKKTSSTMSSMVENRRTLVATPRVGLTLKIAKKARQMAPFIMQKYRFLAYPNKTKKGKIYTVLALYTIGKTPQEIKLITRSTRGAIASYISHFEEGSELDDFTNFIGQKLDARKLAQLYGAWWKKYQNKQM